MASGRLSLLLALEIMSTGRATAPRIHGELLKLGFEIAQSSVAKYMVERWGPPSQGWRTFLRNHAPDIAAMDLFVVPTIGFKLLYGFIIVRIARRDIVWINVTTNPTAEWIARQISKTFPWDGAPRYMIRDRDRIYGAVVTRRLQAMGIRDKPIAPALQSVRHIYDRRYPPAVQDGPSDHGVLVYIKSSMSGDENDYVVDYKRKNPDFPQESTMEQLFSEERRVGNAVGRDV